MIVLAGLLLGAILGSFLATVTLRWPEGRSALAGRSACDACQRPLGPLDLVPILSFALSRGRCRHCGEPIARDHLWIELAAAFIGGAAALLAPLPQALALATMGWLLIPLVWLDFKHLWLPNRLVALLAVAGMALGGLATGVSLVDRLIGGAAGFAALWLLAAAFKRLRGKDGMGAGDPKLLGALGLWVGWWALPPLLLVAAGTSLALVLLLGDAKDRDRPYPFGSALGAAGLVIAFGLALP
ncbi:prepilin peptidase [Sphingomicrobium nitratireducens]|uniref:prepilin peptidase n=1 Tax=Sphingomicrobium nitratireducens TaxID=2964666 RepID=UPI00223F9596|nr:A24 family peptidase [Sphingomicrobium nitratireducens]